MSEVLFDEPQPANEIAIMAAIITDTTFFIVISSLIIRTFYEKGENPFHT